MKDIDTFLVVQKDLGKNNLKVLIVFDRNYEKCLQDIRKKDILGTYRRKQNKKKISTWPRIEPASSRLKDQYS